MKFLDYIKTAFKNIWRRKLRSILTIISIVIGSLAVVSVLTLIFSAKKVFIQQMEAEGTFSNIFVTPNQENLEGGGPFGEKEEQVVENEKKIDDSVIENIKKIDHILDANASSQIWNLQAIKTKEGNEKKFRIDVNAYTPGKATEKTILAGRNFTENDGKGTIIITSNMSESLGFENPNNAIGKKVLLITQKGYQGEGADIPEPNAKKEDWDAMQEKITELEAEIIGVSNPPGIGDRSNTFITMKWGKLINSWTNWEYDEAKGKAYEEKMRESGKRNWDMKDCPDCMVKKQENQIDREGYSTVYVKVDNPDNTLEVAEEIKKLGLGAITAEDILKIFTNVANTIAAVLSAIGAISLGVATIGIINTMLMAMYERTREIGIMRACGAKRKTIRRLFMFEAACIGFSGGILGIIIGEIIILIANRYLNTMLSDQGMAAQNVASLPLWLILATIGITTILGILSGFYPAHRAAKVNPVEALRFE